MYPRSNGPSMARPSAGGEISWLHGTRPIAAGTLCYQSLMIHRNRTALQLSLIAIPQEPKIIERATPWIHVR